MSTHSESPPADVFPIPPAAVDVVPLTGDDTVDEILADFTKAAAAPGAVEAVGVAYHRLQDRLLAR